MKGKEIQETDIQVREIPEKKMYTKPVPQVGNPENTVLVNGLLREVRPTKMKYHRNNVAAFYKIVEMVPLPDIMTMDQNAFGDGRDGDKALMDWLIAVFDDEQFVVENYDEMDTALIEKILTIFKRVNKIDEKEEKQKNAQSRMSKE